MKYIGECNNKLVRAVGTKKVGAYLPENLGTRNPIEYRISGQTISPCKALYKNFKPVQERLVSRVVSSKRRSRTSWLKPLSG